MYDRNRLIELLKSRALEHGQFTLASGKSASYYIDGKQITLEAEGVRLVAEGILDTVADDRIDAVGGLSIGADPIVAAVLVASAIRGQPLRGFLVRKEPKGHGMRRFIEGPLREGDRVLIVDDVITTGGSSFKAIAAAEELDCTVVRVVALVDRLEGAADAFAERGYPFSALLTIRDLGIAQ